jgi:hypothetical protein
MIRMIVRTVASCLVTMLVLGAAMATGASATLPEVGKCEAQVGGRYEDAACTVAAHPAKVNGHYEWHKAAQVEAESGCTNCGVANFEVNAEQDGAGSIGAPTVFETTGGSKIICANTESVLGEQAEVVYRFKGASSVSELLVRYTNCKEAGGEEKECYSPGHGVEEEGEGGTITNLNQWAVEESVKGKLVFLGGKGSPSPTVGIELTAFEPKGENNEVKRLLTVECEGSTGTVWIGGETRARNGKDQILSTISPVDVMTSSLTSTFTQTGGHQEPAALESGSPRFLEGFLKNQWEPVGWDSSWEAASEHGTPVEIKAVR